MANQNESTEELLLDVRVAEASRLFKFYLNQEKKILGTISVTIFLVIMGAGWKYLSVDQSDVHERAVVDLEGGL